jgi:arylsulfatase A-like enzyme
LIIAWPGKLPAGERIAALVELVDLLPTLCALSGLPIPAQAVGQSLVPLLQGNGVGRDAVFAEQYAPDNSLRWVAVRTQQYVYTHYPYTGDELLFDLRTDPQEQVNLLHSESRQFASARAVADALRQRIQAWLNAQQNH